MFEAGTSVHRYIHSSKKAFVDHYINSAKTAVLSKKICRDIYYNIDRDIEGMVLQEVREVSIPASWMVGDLMNG